VTKPWVTLATGANPFSISFDASGNLYSANSNNTISKITPAGSVTQAWATLAASSNPQFMVFDPTGNLYVSCWGTSTVSKINSSGTVTNVWSVGTSVWPAGIVLDAAGNVYTANNNNNTVSKITSSGTVTQAYATLATGSSPFHLAKDASGNLYTTNMGNGKVSRISSPNIYANSFGQKVSLLDVNSIISPEGGANFGTGRDIYGKRYNTTGISTTSGTVGSTTAVLGGIISATNAISASIGVLYSTDINFGTSTSTTIQSNVGAGTYTSSISGLSAATAYYAKAYVTNRAGTTYGSVVNFTTAAAPLTVGSIYGGGIVFYILQSGDNGYDANVQHGLIAPFNSISRQSTNPLPPIVESQIGKFAATISGALNNGTLLGRTNTDAIIANQGSTGTYAALYCRNYANPTSKTFNGVTYTFTVYNDWYMPSIVELNKFRAYVWGTHPSRGVYANYGNNVIYYNGTSGNGNDYAWGKYLSSTMTGQRYKLYYLESGNEDGSAAYNGWTESDRLVVMPIRSF
jgi:hypothetical protein